METGDGGIIIGVLGVEILRGDGRRIPRTGISRRRRRGAGAAAGVAIGGVAGAPCGTGARACSGLRAALVTGESGVLPAGLITRAEVAILIHEVRGATAVVLLADGIENTAGLGGGNAIRMRCACLLGLLFASGAADV